MVSRSNDETVGPWGEDKENDNGQSLIDFCKEQKWVIMNGKFKHRDIHKFTWSQPLKNQKSIIDYIITRKAWIINVQYFRVKRGLECGTDHNAVIAKVAFPLKAKLKQVKNENDSERKVIDDPIYLVNLLQEESVKFLYQNRLSSKLKVINEDWEAKELYDFLKKSITEAADESLGRERQNRRKTEWITKEVMEAIEHNSLQ